MFVALLFPISINAIEGMSSDEIAIREEFDIIKKELYECYAINNVDPRNIDDSVCIDERSEYENFGQIFNEFMREKEARRPSYKIRRQQRQELEDKYSTYSEENLGILHKENCTTKWGSSDSTECQAIASQFEQKRWKRLNSN